MRGRRRQVKRDNQATPTGWISWRHRFQAVQLTASVRESRSSSVRTGATRFRRG